MHPVVRSDSGHRFSQQCHDMIFRFEAGAQSLINILIHAMIIIILEVLENFTEFNSI